MIGYHHRVEDLAFALEKSVRIELLLLLEDGGKSLPSGSTSFSVIVELLHRCPAPDTPFTLETSKTSFENILLAIFRMMREIV